MFYAADSRPAWSLNETTIMTKEVGKDYPDDVSYRESCQGAR